MKEHICKSVAGALHAPSLRRLDIVQVLMAPQRRVANDNEGASISDAEIVVVACWPGVGRVASRAGRWEIVVLEWFEDLFTLAAEDGNAVDGA